MKRLELKRVNVDDLEFLFALYNDPQVNEYGVDDGGFTITKEHILNTIQHFEKQADELLIVKKDD